jgi:lipopolysaccharide export system protein LptA
MKRDSQGKSVLDTLDATGNVEIKTTSETLTGEKGFYNAKDNTAQVTGNVRITRGPNILEGARADIDLTTQTSRLYAPSGPNGRVRGIFFPSSKSP